MPIESILAFCKHFKRTPNSRRVGGWRQICYWERERVAEKGKKGACIGEGSHVRSIFGDDELRVRHIRLPGKGEEEE